MQYHNKREQTNCNNLPKGTLDEAEWFWVESKAQIDLGYTLVTLLSILSIGIAEHEEPTFVKIMFQSLRDVLITSWTEDYSAKQNMPCQSL